MELSLVWQVEGSIVQSNAPGKVTGSWEERPSGLWKDVGEDLAAGGTSSGVALWETGRVSVMEAEFGRASIMEGPCSDSPDWGSPI